MTNRKKKNRSKKSSNTKPISNGSKNQPMTSEEKKILQAAQNGVLNPSPSQADPRGQQKQVSDCVSPNPPPENTSGTCVTDPESAEGSQARYEAPKEEEIREVSSKEVPNISSKSREHQKTPTPRKDSDNAQSGPIHHQSSTNNDQQSPTNTKHLTNTNKSVSNEETKPEDIAVSSDALRKHFRLVTAQGPKPATSRSTRSGKVESKEPQSLELDPVIRRCTDDEFFAPIMRSSGESTPPPLPMIDVLMEHPLARQARRNHSRSLASRTTGLTADTVVTPELEPTRVRLRSLFLLDILQDIAKVDLGHRKAGSHLVAGHASFLFLHPFKFFITYEEDIRRRAEGLKLIIEADKTNSGVQPLPETTPTSETVHDAEQSKAGSGSEPPNFNSKKAYQQLELLLQLFDHDLCPILTLRHDLCKGTATSITFENLWLLFNLGELVYERDPGQEGSGEPPRLCRLTWFSGGRPALSDKTIFESQNLARAEKPYASNQEDITPSETPFAMRTFLLYSNGDSFGPVETTSFLPPWDGAREIHDLVFFPERFCRPGIDFPNESLDAWKSDLIQRGKKFCELTPGTLRDYHGIGVDMELRQEEYRSQVILDIHTARKEALKRPSPPKHFGPDTIQKSLILYKGKLKELYKEKEIYSKGDTIHDDITMEYDLALRRRDALGPSSGKFKSVEELQADEDFALFPAQISGFVLKSRKWANLSVDKLQRREQDFQLWNELQLRSSYKQALLSLVQNDVRSETFAQPEYDVVKGKGTGTVVLLHGPPGVGKTLTAEAMAAYTRRGLYPITCGDLGEGITNIESNLQTILYRGHKWGCILLLDEVDVFFIERANDSIERNSIVSVFLRSIEYYSGIIFLTTNRPKEMDRAIGSRITLSLFYPPLNRKATRNIWQSYLKDIQRFASNTNTSQAHIRIQKRVRTWWKAKYTEAIEQQGSWWSGRMIQIVFRRAVALATLEMTSKPTYKSKADNGDGTDSVHLNATHFDAVESLLEDFQTNLGIMTNGISPHKEQLKPSEDGGPETDDNDDYFTP